MTISKLEKIVRSSQKKANKRKLYGRSIILWQILRSCGLAFKILALAELLIQKSVLFWLQRRLFFRCARLPEVVIPYVLTFCLRVDLCAFDEGLQIEWLKGKLVEKISAPLVLLVLLMHSTLYLKHLGL